MEKTLQNLETTWTGVAFDKVQHKQSEVNILKMNEENFEMLEEN